MNEQDPLPVARTIPVALAVAELATPPRAIPIVEPSHRETVRPVREPELDPEPPFVSPFELIARPFRVVSSVVEWVFGFAALMVALAVLAAIPVAQFLSLGYLLEAGGRVARSGRFRDGFIGIRLAARLGGGVLGCWLMLLPVRFVADLTRSSQIIDPGGTVAQAWRAGLFVLIGATAFHIAAAVARGGRLRYFFWPFNVVWLARRVLRGGYYTEARDSVWNTVVSLRLPHYFSLGFRGFLGALAWLALPVTLLAMGHAKFPAAPVVGFVGAATLAIVLLYLPFLQMRFAARNRLRAMFQLGAVRRAYRRAPWAHAAAFVVTLLFALPLYLLKIEVVPREAAWLPSLVFVLFIFPARLLTGWALGRARRRTEPRHWFFRWTGRLPLLPAAGFYVLVVFFTQYTSWNGVFSLYEQHAFLVPVPFLNL
jgi:hypothetical protein